MDRILRRELDAIARDSKSGAAELTLRATAAVEAWLGRYPHPENGQLLEVARQVCFCRPSMTPLLRLANEIALSMGERKAGTDLARALRRFHTTVTKGPTEIARRFRLALARRREPARIVTYSYSSTVLGALLAARRYIRTVLCSESRPGNEGRKTAQRLAKAGIRVQFETDANLFSGILDCNLVIVGADAVLLDVFFNKAGTESLLFKARDMDASFWVVTDTNKFWPETLVQHLGWNIKGMERKKRPRGRLWTLWPQAPKNVDARYVETSLLGLTHFDPRMRFLTEKGWMTPAQVRKELKKIRISPRLKELVD